MHGQQNNKFTHMHGQQNHKYTEMHGQQNNKFTHMHGQQNDKYTEMHGQPNFNKWPNMLSNKFFITDLMNLHLSATCFAFLDPASVLT